MTSKTLIVLTGVVLTLATAAAGYAQPKAPAPSVTFSTKPAPAAAGATTFTVVVKDAAGKPVTGADVAVEFVMPAMPMMKMPEMRNTTMLKAPEDAKVAATGTYVGAGQIMMAGTWNVTVKVKRDGKEFVEKKLTVIAK